MTSWSGPIPPKKPYKLWTEEQVAGLVRARVLPARVRGRPRMPVQRVAA